MLRTLTGVVVVLALFLSACGGGSDDPTAAPDDSSNGDADSTAAASTPTAEADDGDGDDGDDGGGATGGSGSGRATIGSTTWTFELSGDSREVCRPDFSGSFFVSMIGTDENGEESVFSVVLPSTGGAAVVQAGTAAELWIADVDVYARFPDLPEGVSATGEVDGNRAFGSGTFYEDRALQATRQTGSAYESGVVDGTFEVSCP